MQSIRYLYRVGYGPSSSHTMGPSNAAKILKERYPLGNKYEITLYNSLALTGKGHFTDVAIIKELENIKVDFHFKIDESKHPNTLLFEIYQDELLLNRQLVFSVGGGRIIFDGEESLEPSIYPHSTFDDIKAYCKKKKISLYDYIIEVEGKEIEEFLLYIWSKMNESINNGLEKEGVLPGDLKVVRKAKTLTKSKLKFEAPEVTENRVISSYAFAVNEENASGGMVVTAPTCGASGTLPAVLKYMKEKHRFSNKKIIRGLAVAGLIGNLIKFNGSISGAEAGCQAEVGSACSMAAAAHATLFNLSIDQVEYAAEIAMEHHLGLTCDPINGFVQIPCIERNAVAALRAVDACGLAFFLSDTRKISFDLVVKTMLQTGKDMHDHYKETSIGGLAKYYKDTNCW